CFEEVSGLRANYNKSKIHGIVVNEHDMSDMARWMRCDIGEFSFTCLGLSIGENMRRVNAWAPVVEKFKKKIGGKSLVCRIEGVGLIIDGCGNEIGDRWRWALDEHGEFTVKDLSRLIEDKMLRSDNGDQETIWNKLVPKKVNIFVWRALRERLSVRVELDSRGIDLDSVICPSCNDSVETCAQSLITCDLSMSVWNKIYNWWKVRIFNAFTIDELRSSNRNVNVPNYCSCVWQV
nr:RNA-directed DNA polymerase, eukaryota, reverse transcriptase zinc-binding domain protein [Tanacetum cinerariifolium]